MDAVKEQPEKFPNVHEYIDTSIGLHSYIVIDSVINGNSCGGIRISEDITLDEIKALAHAMTLKYCFLKASSGGAKAGIMLPKNCTPEQRKKILEAFGRNASSLLRERTYIPWTDMNSSVDDIAIIMKAAGCKFHEIPDSAYFTALTVVSAIKAACETKNIDISTITAIIEGFGVVGMNLAAELDNWGVKIVGVSTVKGAIYDADGLDINKLLELNKRYKDDFINYYGTESLERKELLLEMETDVLIPSARPWSINETNMKKIKAKMIVPSANLPLTRDAEEFLHQHRILCLPDFVCNLGGACGSILIKDGNHKKTVYHFIMKEFGQLVKEIIWKSTEEHCFPSEIAKKISEKNHNLNGIGAMNKSSANKLINKYFLKVPGLSGWMSIQKQRRVFTDNIKYIKNHC
jgi:glutamate dehydrogenase (NAD(P)+)